MNIFLCVCLNDIFFSSKIIEDVTSPFLILPYNVFDL